MSAIDRKNILPESDEWDSDARNGEGEDWKNLERLPLKESINRKQGEILMASAWTANVRQRLAEIEEVALEEFKKEKQAQIKDAAGKTNDFRWALLEVEDWGLAMKESLLPDGTPLKFSNYFLANLKRAVVKSEAAMSLAKIALRAALNVGYLGVIVNFPFELIGAPFSNLARTHSDLAKDLKALEKRLQMWRDIADKSGLPEVPGKGSIYKYGADNDSMVNPADPYFEADEEVQGILKNEITQTITNARTADGKAVNSKEILERYFNYLNEYRDNYWADVPKPAPKREPTIKPNPEELEGAARKTETPKVPQAVMTREQRREARRKAAEKQKAIRYAEQLAHVRAERIRQKDRERREKQRKEKAELRKELVERIERERLDTEKKRKRAMEGEKGERLGFFTTDPTDPPEHKRPRTDDIIPPAPKPFVPSPTPPKPVTPAEKNIPEKTIPEKVIPERTIPEKTIPEKTIPEKLIPSVPTPPPTPLKKDLFMPNWVRSLVQPV
ncbi:hypothetical protein K445DRAFT_14785 [Daldinia sp. EC12]|nr:hypothetical protein F4774DRAFT_367985 [Daldinia eschscholtzii]OTB12358.1 hypothetical protein K445DRAFT_14785 [Daldinia sp. EC12]